MNERRRAAPAPIVLAGLAVLTSAAFIGRLMAGPSETPWTDVTTALFGRHAVNGSVDLLLEFRLPQAIAATLAGAALSLSGLQMQTVFQNPLAGPWTLGLVAGAQFGVTLLIVSGTVFGLPLSGALSPISLSGLTIAASLGALAVLICALSLARHVSAATLLIAGLLVAATLDGVRGFLIHLVGLQYELLFLSWNQAGFGGVTWPQLRVFAIVAGAGLVLALALAKNLNGLLLGDGYARSLGINLTVTRRLSMLSTLLLAGSATAFTGAVLFLDLAVAHVCRGVFKTADHRFLVPAVVMVGALTALIADTAVVLLPGDEILPVNIVTCVLGGPVVLWVLWRGDRDATS